MPRCTSRATAALALFAATGIQAQAPTTGSRPVVAVLDFTNSSLVEHDTYEPFTVGIAALLLADLQQNPDIEVVERERLREVLAEIDLGQTGRADPTTAAKAGKVLGAQHVIFGVFVIDRRGKLRLDARAVNVETSRLEHVETVEDDADNLLRAVSTLGRKLRTDLKLPLRSSSEQSPAEAARRGQVLANLKYARALMAEDRDQRTAAIGLYQAFLAETPGDYAPSLRESVQARIRLLAGQNDDDGPYPW